ncbi:MAG TPA: hypothetical protein DCM86_16690, partial [Verrucomicrobiales bacterium]|nr:hypothetical protein [Verrucomicrobiales bacterium]
MLLLMFGLLAMAGRSHGHDEFTTPRAGATNRVLVDFAHPLRDYACRRIAGWSVLTEEEMHVKDPELTRKALARIEAKLNEVHRLLPTHTLARLQKVPIFLLYGEEASHGGKADGAQYFPPLAPDQTRTLDPRMGGAVVIYSAKHFSEMTDFGALKVLVHELSHAWHLTQWSHNKPEINSAYQAAMVRGLYHNVRTSNGKSLPEAYAAANQLEYFAELSCIWFCGNDYFPFDGGDLRLYDVGGYR